MKINVYQGNESTGNINVKIENSTAEIWNIKKLDTIKSKSQNGMPFFSKLKDGIYRLEVSRVGYKTTYQKIELECSKINSSDFIEVDVLLFAGDQKEKFFFLNDDSFLDSSGEIFFGDNINLIGQSWPRPAYPSNTKVYRNITVSVLVLIDEQGNVISTMTEGKNPFHEASEKAAKKAKFLPVMYKGKFIKVKGLMKYYFYSNQ